MSSHLAIRDLDGECEFQIDGGGSGFVVTGKVTQMRTDQNDKPIAICVRQATNLTPDEKREVWYNWDRVVSFTKVAA